MSLSPTLIKQFRQLLGDANVIADPALLRVYECDALAAYTQVPDLVVLPETVEQVLAVLRLCHEQQIPVVARGAGTGLSGGALPVPGGIVLGLAKLNRILGVDPINRTATVQAGVRNLAISEAARPHGLYYPPDPSSQIACSIGGNIAENAGGVHCLKYGLTVHNVLQIKLATIGGELLTLGGSGLDGAGYDLLALAIGSEGLLGVVVEATLRLLPTPPRVQVLLAAFATIEQAGAAVADIIGAGLIPAGLELMDNAAIRATEAFVHAGYPVQAAAIVLCELDGQPEQVAADLARAEALLKAAGASEIRVAADAAQRQRFWAGRKAAFPAVGRIASDYYCMDGTIPRRHLAAVLAEIAELGQRYGLSVVNVFHAGDGNLHPLILYDAGRPGDFDKAEALGGDILELCVRVGGTITGEHGVGHEKLPQMCVQFQAAELEQFHALKKAFDPDGLLNPGKAVPTLHRCAELGKMHVHGGRLPHPELERF
ncbi:FAD-linked oxidase C-terminal domain-containing protein [Methylomonas sp. MED-D]|uniref:FAD-linked oxidase C-terminal domain-containing protein n=1 Tax=unclassified Methylomonas TaxID=2608980 RepID=UPI0028A521FC|nr:FAD-linked oxidase C-terminal domain-containing protein [Methylomonas sp. MV1]MDT4328617.1 FAD-linked oxidase C-terminal domain-containing protein [Methylomonas sp. MV1]